MEKRVMGYFEINNCGFNLLNLQYVSFPSSCKNIRLRYALCVYAFIVWLFFPTPCAAQTNREGEGGGGGANLFFEVYTQRFKRVDNFWFYEGSSTNSPHTTKRTCKEKRLRTCMLS